MISTLLLCLATHAVEPIPEAKPDDLRIEVPDSLRRMSLPLGGALEPLRTRDHDAAVRALTSLDRSDWTTPQIADHAFLMGWSLVHAGRPREALEWAEKAGRMGTAPIPYRALVEAEALRAHGRHDEALAALGEIDDEDVLASRAWVIEADLLDRLGRGEESSALYARVAERSDPIDGNAFALYTLAESRGFTTSEGRDALRRVWVWYPGTTEGTRASEKLNADDAFKPSGDDLARRAERWMTYGSWDRAILAARAALSKLSAGTEQSCRARYALGRSIYKQNHLSDSIQALGNIGAECVGVEGGYGYKGLYLKGMAQFRKGQYDISAATYQEIPDRYPDASYADDGLTRAGIALMEGGSLEGAIRTWQRALDDYPDGDTVPEATFRLAFHLYDAGRPDEAIEVADKVAALPPGVDPDHVIGGAYWAARWRMYPDVRSPSTPVSDAGRRQEAVDRWAALVRRYPYHYYATVAYSRLIEVAPSVASEVASEPRTASQDRPWQVRIGAFIHPSVGYGVSLVRLGLVKEALAEWDRADLNRLDPEERAWLMELHTETGDWLWAFKLMHYYMRSHPPGSLGEREAEIVAVAFPQRYWEDVQRYAEPYDYPARMFHGLIREESNFDRNIKSHAGAIGLAQLMPATARLTAGWLGRSVTTSQLVDAQLNLTLGSRYLQSVYQQVGDNPYLAMASYNAGPARIVRWAREWGQPPLDEYVERIPFRETRGYVKRVTSSWQTMRYAYDQSEAPFPDLSRFNHSVGVP